MGVLWLSGWARVLMFGGLVRVFGTVCSDFGLRVTVSGFGCQNVRVGVRVTPCGCPGVRVRLFRQGVQACVTRSRVFGNAPRNGFHASLDRPQSRLEPKRARSARVVLV